MTTEIDKRRYTDEQIQRALAKLRQQDTTYGEDAGLAFHFVQCVEALGDDRLDNGAKRVFAVMLRHASYAEGTGVIDRRTIVIETGMSEKTVSHKIHTLTECGYINTTRFSLGQGSGTASAFAVRGLQPGTRARIIAALTRLQGCVLGIEPDPEQDNIFNSGNITESGMLWDKSGDVTKKVNVTVPAERDVTDGKVPESGMLWPQDPGERDVTHARVSYTKKNKKEEKKKTRGRDARDPNDVDEDVREQFEKFWKAYPADAARKGGKSAALIMFADIVAGEFVSNPAKGPSVKYASCPAEKLVHAAECFATAMSGREQYVPGVSVWFNGGKWEAFLDWESAAKPKFRIDINRRTGRLVRVPVED